MTRASRNHAYMDSYCISSHRTSIPPSVPPAQKCISHLLLDELCMFTLDILMYLPRPPPWLSIDITLLSCCGFRHHGLGPVPLVIDSKEPVQKHCWASWNSDSILDPLMCILTQNGMVAFSKGSMEGDNSGNFFSNKKAPANDWKSILATLWKQHLGCFQKKPPLHTRIKINSEAAEVFQLGLL